ncbi:glucosaminidase domain-containing protein [Paenibacillus sp. sgz302251]|uniref:glucosaminidase domain-containing protein n=1 Tax=Paenibacillus sp. sgz302251 TaxID=3414493 RepID=UPI003C7EA6AE
MRKKLIQQAFFYLLVMSVIITLGMYIQPLNSSPALEPPGLAEEVTNPAPLTTAEREPLKLNNSHPMPIHMPIRLDHQNKLEVQIQSLENELGKGPEVEQGLMHAPDNAPELETIQEKAQEAELEPKQEVAQVVVPKLTYEVTAYYLNVRTKPNARSPILKVVEKGMRMEVASIMDNVWLELKEGGFIHGGYAKLVVEENEASIALNVAVERSSTAPSVFSPPGEAETEQEQEAKQKKEVETNLEPSKPTSVVESDSGLTEDHIAIIFEGTALADYELEEAILEIEDEYGINAYFTIAVMKLESGNGKSKIAKNKNNLFGLNAIDGDQYNRAFSFETKADSVRRFGQLLSKHYVGKGLETIEQVAKKYCPANSKWSGLVKSIMKSDYRKL